MISESITRWNARSVVVKSGLDPSDESGGISTGSESLVQQEFAKEADINWIVKRYSAEELAARGGPAPLYGDFTTVPSYQDSLNVVLKADEMFGDLPSSIRNRFENDPAQLIAFVHDPANLEEAYRLGLAVKPVVVPSDADRIVEAVGKLQPVGEPVAPP